MSDELDEFYRLLIRQAQAGDMDAAESLLREFSQQRAKVHPMVIEYVASCAETWLQAGLSTGESAKAFNVQRPAHRSAEDPDMRGRYIRALRCYFLLRGRGRLAKQALFTAAEHCQRSASAFRKIVERPEYDTLREAALWIIAEKNLKVAKRCRRKAGMA